MPRQRKVYVSDGTTETASLSGTVERDDSLQEPKLPRRRGRPETYTDALADEICRRMSTGRSLTSVCRDADIPHRELINKWILSGKYPHLNASYARARDLLADTLFEQCLDIADQSDNDYIPVTHANGKTTLEANPSAVNRARLRIDTRKWVAGKLRPAKYGDKVLLAGADGGDLSITNKQVIDIAGMPKDQRDTLRQIIREARARSETPMIDVTPRRQDDSD